jgi:hypothetical protein
LNRNITIAPFNPTNFLILGSLNENPNIGLINNPIVVHQVGANERGYGNSDCLAPGSSNYRHRKTTSSATHSLDPIDFLILGSLNEDPNIGWINNPIVVHHNGANEHGYGNSGCLAQGSSN